MSNLTFKNTIESIMNSYKPCLKPYGLTKKFSMDISLDSKKDYTSQVSLKDTKKTKSSKYAHVQTDYPNVLVALAVKDQQKLKSEVFSIKNEMIELKNTIKNLQVSVNPEFKANHIKINKPMHNKNKETENNTEKQKLNGQDPDH
jgi:hypothetical protein